MSQRSQSSLTTWAARSGMGDLYEGDCYYDPSTGDVWCDQSGGGGSETGGGMFFYAPSYGNSFAPYPPQPDPGAGFWDWFSGWFPPADPGTLEPIPIDWTQIGASIGSGPPPTSIGVCPPGTGRGKNGANDYECTPFDPPNTASGQRQRDPAAQQAAAARAAQAQRSQQNALQQAAQACAQKGGRLIQTQTGYACQLPNGQTQAVNLDGGIPWWILALIGVVLISR